MYDSNIYMPTLLYKCSINSSISRKIKEWKRKLIIRTNLTLFDKADIQLPLLKFKSTFFLISCVFKTFIMFSSWRNKLYYFYFLNYRKKSEFCTLWVVLLPSVQFCPVTTMVTRLRKSTWCVCAPITFTTFLY